MNTLRERIVRELAASRARTDALTDVEDAELVAQHSPLMSPLVWDLAHVGNHEEIWLARAAGGLAPFRRELDDLYDAFAHPRANRPSLPILKPSDARVYIRDVRDRALESVSRAGIDIGDDLLADGFVHAMVFQHEQQHAETMLATHQLRGGEPVLASGATLPGRPPGSGEISCAADTIVDGGPFAMGTSTDPWALDNERPSRVVDVGPFRIDVFPVSNRAYAEFVSAGGYDDERCWTPEGWAHRQAEGLTAPGFWDPDGAGWFTRRRFGRVEELPADEPVQHVTFHEASAYARWTGRRLPTEAEWEKACGWDPVAGISRRFPWGAEDPTPERANLAFDPRLPGLRPALVGAYPAGASAYGVQQMIGDVWEWTSTPLRAYPGFRAWPYREYSEVFFGSEYRVLRGGSWASHPSAVRTTFRNWDYPIRRQIFAGFRTAISVEGI
jgi:iron(II)-dependent oxidoreductase